MHTRSDRGAALLLGSLLAALAAGCSAFDGAPAPTAPPARLEPAPAPSPPPPPPAPLLAAPPAPRGALLPRDLLFALPAVAEARLSPDGSRVAVLAGGRLELWRLGPPGDGPPIGVAAGETVLDVLWALDGRLLVLARDARGLGLWTVWPPADAASSPDGAALQAGELLRLDGADARFLPAPAAAPDAIVETSGGEAGRRLLRVDPAAATIEVLAEAGPEVEAWATDLSGRPHLALRRLPDGGSEVWTLVAGVLGERVLRCLPLERCRLLAPHADGRRVYLVTDHGRDRLELALLDPASGELAAVAGDPSGGSDLAGSAIAADGRLLASWSPQGGVVAHDAAVAAALSLLPEGLAAAGRRFSFAAAAGRWLISVEGPATPGRTFLVDPAAGTVRLLLRRRPGLDDALLAPARAVRYPARDALPIPALLTLPRDVDAAGLPAVVLAPDSPWAGPPGAFDPLPQLLADRGYAVLQPAPRGSLGWGRAHLAAGRGQWGAAALDDLADGVRWLVAEGIADPDRVAVAGGGWGGWAVLAALAMTPDLYAAGVSLGGPVDLLPVAEAAATAEPARRALLRHLLGDPADPRLRERLARQSPLRQAGSIRAPLLRAERADDGLDGVAAGARLVSVLAALHRPVRALPAAVGGPGWSALAAEVEAFLAAHLGGRVEEAPPGQVVAGAAGGAAGAAPAAPPP